MIFSAQGVDGLPILQALLLPPRRAPLTGFAVFEGVFLFKHHIADNSLLLPFKASFR